MIYRHVIKEEIIAINCDWVSNQACRLSHNIHVISNSFIMLNDLFEMIRKRKHSNESFEYIN